MPRSISLEEFKDALREAMTSGSAALFACDCEIDYQGRARSHLGPGERIVIVKEDGTIIVHRKSGRNPVNWMPPRSKTEVVQGEGTISLLVTKQKEQERMEIIIRSVKGLQTFHLRDHERPDLYGTEKDFVRKLLENPDLIEKGFRLTKNERLTIAGSIDITGLDTEGRPVVVEVKRSRATPQDVIQLKRYVESMSKRADRPVRGILVCPSSSSKARRLLAEYGLEMRRVNPFRLERKPTQSNLSRYVPN